MKKIEKDKFFRLVSFVLKLDKNLELQENMILKEIGAADWQLIDLAACVEGEFDVRVPADDALSMERLKDWIDFIEKAE